MTRVKAVQLLVLATDEGRLERATLPHAIPASEELQDLPDLIKYKLGLLPYQLPGLVNRAVAQAYQIAQLTRQAVLDKFSLLRTR